MKETHKLQCKICNSNDIKKYISYNQTKIFECNECSTLFKNLFSPVLYTRERGLAEEGLKYYLKKVEEKPRKDKFVRELDHLTQYLPSGKILDVGCATGFFLKIAREKRWETYGVEINQSMAAHAKREYNLDVFVGTLEEANFKENNFDVVTLWNTLSQIRDPLSLLREIKGILKPEGLLILQVANRNSALFRTKAVFFRYFKNSRPAKWSLFSKNQFYCYSSKGLKNLLRRFNFRILELRSENEIWPNRERIFTNKWFKEEIKRVLRFLSAILPGFSSHYIIYSKNLK